jgi:hypothetical protein
MIKLNVDQEIWKDQHMFLDEHGIFFTLFPNLLHNRDKLIQSKYLMLFNFGKKKISTVARIREGVDMLYIYGLTHIV